MSLRLEAFNQLPGHAWYRRTWKRLSEADLKWAQQWITSHDHLDRCEFELAVNRMFMDGANAQVSQKNIVRELISASNSSVPWPESVQKAIEQRQERMKSIRGW